MGFFNLAESNIALSLKKLLSNKYLPIFCLIIAIINKSLIANIYSDLEGDKSIYLLFSANFLEQKQFLEPISFIENEQTYFRFNPAINSPFYSFLAIPLLQITNSFSKTAIIIDILSWIIFLTGLYKLSTLIFKDSAISSLLILCAGFFIYPHEIQSTPKDTLAIGILLWSVYFTCSFIRHKSPGILLTLMLSLLFTALALTKYLYFPLVLVFLLILLFYSVILKSKRHFLLAIVASVLNFGVLWLVLSSLSNQDQTNLNLTLIQNPVKEFTKGFYPENIISTFPFISSSFINVNFWGVQLASILKSSYSSISKSFNILDLVILGFLLAGLGWIRKQMSKEAKPVFFIMLIISIAILGMLVYMSVSFKGVQYIGRDSLWTYVSEPRSYLFIIVFLQLLLFYLILKTNLNPLLKNFLFLLFVIECAHGLYFTIKQTSQKEMIQKQLVENSSNKNIVAYTNYLSEKNKGKEVRLITNDNHLHWYSLLHSIKSYTFSNNTNCNAFNFKSNSILVFATYEGHPFPAEKCMENYELMNLENLPPFIIKVYKIQ